MQNIKSIISEELNFVDNEIKNVSLEQDDIKQALEKFLSGSSKRIRSTITSLYITAVDKKVLPQCIKIMAAGEIIHNASLLHDDVIDNAKTRRGETTIGEVFSPYVSILSGDYLLSIATEKLMEVNDNNILKIFLNCTKQMCNAELTQFFLRGKKPDIDQYIRICEGKTAFLFEAIMESCAIIENLPVADAVSFARNFGIFFQLKNDLEKLSAECDAANEIFTPKDILGIEKTSALIDNYLKRLRGDIGQLPDNIYKKGLEGLLIEL